MPRIDLVKKSPISASGRARQLEGMFDVPRKKESVVEWHGEIPIDDFDWHVGLIESEGDIIVVEYTRGRQRSLMRMHQARERSDWSPSRRACANQTAALQFVF